MRQPVSLSVIAFMEATPGGIISLRGGETTDFDPLGVAAVIDRVRARLGDNPVDVSVDLDVLDQPTPRPTGTPEAGGLSSRELLAIIRGLRGMRIVPADIVEVAPAYDHAEITAIAAPHVGYELISSKRSPLSRSDQEVGRPLVAGFNRPALVKLRVQVRFAVDLRVQKSRRATTFNQVANSLG